MIRSIALRMAGLDAGDASNFLSRFVVAIKDSEFMIPAVAPSMRSSPEYAQAPMDPAMQIAVGNSWFIVDAATEHESDYGVTFSDLNKYPDTRIGQKGRICHQGCFQHQHELFP